MLTPNPKTEGTCIIDCRPQTGPCPMNCNQCFYNRPGAFYVDINEPYIPSIADAKGKLVRMNCGHDSNLSGKNGATKKDVIKTAQQYENFFFNTSIPRFDFPGPVVFTANPSEEECVLKPTSADWPQVLSQSVPPNVMYVRLRVSASNLNHIIAAINVYSEHQVPIVLTFMAYYEKSAVDKVMKNIDYSTLHEFNIANIEKYYIWKTRHINSYYCPTREFKEYVVHRMKNIGGRLVTMCGTLDSNWCRDCGNCERYYAATKKHLNEI